MNVTITNYRGLASASLDLSRICLLAGPNEAGKTSASQAFAAALTGEPVPIAGVKKAQAGLLVRAGNANGSVELVTDAGNTNIQWPSAKVKTEGRAPYASHFAAGIQSIVNMEEKDRAKTLTEYLKAVPVRSDLDVQLASMKLPVAILDQLWKLIEETGWDNVHAQTKEKGARYKGQWQEVTGEQYGSKKADSWVPNGYDDSMGDSEDKLKAIVSDSRDALEAAIAANAVDDSRRSDLEKIAADLSQRRINLLASEALSCKHLTHQLEECEGFITSINKNKEDLVKKRNEAPGTEQAKGVPCPHCNTKLEIKGGTLHLIKDGISKEEITARQELIDKLDGQIKSITDGVQKHMGDASRLKAQIAEFESERTQKINDGKRLVAEAEAAEKELAKPVAEAEAVSIDDCRTTLAAAELRLKAFQAKFAADRLHNTICQNAELLTKLAPEGIRADVLVKSLKKFNDSLAPFCKTAGWRPVTLESDFLPTYGGTIYLLLSESAKFRVRVILQIGMALLDKSEALIVDAADILDKGGRNGLFKVVKSTGLPSLITMTIDGKDIVPNLAKAGIGASYWLNEENTAEPVT